MANSIASTKNYTALLDEVYKRAACSTCPNSPRRMARAERNLTLGQLSQVSGVSKAMSSSATSYTYFRIDTASTPGYLTAQ